MLGVFVRCGLEALNVAMMQKNVQKVHIGLRRDVQFGQDRQDFLAVLVSV